jgi:DNA-binding transcriptional ArsR family regulator
MFEGIIISKTMRYLLVLLYINPGKEYYLREIARRIKQQPNLVRNNLRRLERTGMIKSRRSGISIYYSVNPNHAIYPHIKSIVEIVYVADRRLYANLKDK